MWYTHYDNDDDERSRFSFKQLALAGATITGGILLYTNFLQKEVINLSQSPIDKEKKDVLKNAELLKKNQQLEEEIKALKKEKALYTATNSKKEENNDITYSQSDNEYDKEFIKKEKEKYKTLAKANLKALDTYTKKTINGALLTHWMLKFNMDEYASWLQNKKIRNEPGVKEWLCELYSSPTKYRNRDKAWEIARSYPVKRVSYKLMGDLHYRGMTHLFSDGDKKHLPFYFAAAGNYKISLKHGVRHDNVSAIINLGLIKVIDKEKKADMGAALMYNDMVLEEDHYKGLDMSAQLMSIAENTSSPFSNNTKEKLYQQLLKHKKATGSAAFWLGYMYEYGIYIEKDYTKARKYYQNAILMGHIGARYKLGNIYFKGLGVKQNLERAYRHARIAADWGDKDALYQLAITYRDGVGKKKDNEKATTCFIYASLAGHPKAPKITGDAYMTGNGIGINKEEAKAFYNLGIFYNDTEAKTQYDKLSEK